MARRDPGLIKRLLAQLETRYIIVWRGLNLFKSDITGLKSMRWLTIEAVSSFLDEAICIYLGKDRSQVEYVCLDISKYPEINLVLCLLMVSLVTYETLIRQFLVMMGLY